MGRTEEKGWSILKNIKTAIKRHQIISLKNERSILCIEGSIVDWIGLSTEKIRTLGNLLI